MPDASTPAPTGPRGPAGGARARPPRSGAAGGGALGAGRVRGADRDHGAAGARRRRLRADRRRLPAVGERGGGVDPPGPGVDPAGLAGAVRRRRGVGRAHPAHRGGNAAELDVRRVHPRAPAHPGAGRHPAAAVGVHRGGGAHRRGVPAGRRRHPGGERGAVVVAAAADADRGGRGAGAASGSPASSAPGSPRSAELVQTRTAAARRAGRHRAAGAPSCCPSTCTTVRCSTCWPPGSTWRTPGTAATRPRSTGSSVALVESSRLLRSTVAELHPAVLARAGLPAALRDLARTAAARGGFTAEVTGRRLARRPAHPGRPAALPHAPASCWPTWPGTRRHAR